MLAMFVIPSVGPPKESAHWLAIFVCSTKQLPKLNKQNFILILINQSMFLTLPIGFLSRGPMKIKT